MKKFYLLIFTLTYFSNLGLAQDRHLILFKDKNTSATLSPEEFLSAKSLERRAKQGLAITNRDYPVNEAYIQSISSTGATVVYVSKWLNAALVEVSADDQLNVIKSLSFVQQSSNFEELYGVTKINSVQKQTTGLNYGNSKTQLEMIGVDQFHQQGITGKGMSIAVFDSGFPGVDHSFPFLHLIDDKRIKATYDFVENEIEVYDDDSHGTQVLSTMAAFQDGELIGVAYEADYYLFVTEDVSSESPIEEFYWLVAAERADSIGVDIINSSLGYSTFDNPQYNYSSTVITGDRAIISQAADFAAATGILVVNSTGNSYSPWGLKLHLPSDGDSVLAVGSVNADGNLSSFSSRGPTADGRIKPDVVAMGGQTVVAYPNGNIGNNSGTSFSSPLIAGFAACVWQAFPHLNNMELIELLRNTGDRANMPNDNYGYGVPHFNRIVSILGKENDELQEKQIRLFPNPIQNKQIKLHFSADLLYQDCQIQVYDLKGQQIINQWYQINLNRYTLDLKNEVQGIYSLIVTYGDKYESFKVLIQ